MLPRTNRLKGKKDIENVFRSGKGFKEDFLILKTINNKLETSRFAFVISNKISKKAAVRNRLKRKLSELVRIKLKTIKTGVDNILVVSPGLEKKDFWEIEQILNQLFKKAKIIR